MLQRSTLTLTDLYLDKPIFIFCSAVSTAEMLMKYVKHHTSYNSAIKAQASHLTASTAYSSLSLSTEEKAFVESILRNGSDL